MRHGKPPPGHRRRSPYRALQTRARLIARISQYYRGNYVGACRRGATEVVWGRAGAPIRSGCAITHRASALGPTMRVLRHICRCGVVCIAFWKCATCVILGLHALALLSLGVNVVPLTSRVVVGTSRTSCASPTSYTPRLLRALAALCAVVVTLHIVCSPYGASMRRYCLCAWF